MKKTIYLALIGLLVISMFSGCINSKEYHGMVYTSYIIQRDVDCEVLEKAFRDLISHADSYEIRFVKSADWDYRIVMTKPWYGSMREWHDEFDADWAWTNYKFKIKKEEINIKNCYIIYGSISKLKKYLNCYKPYAACYTKTEKTEKGTFIIIEGRITFAKCFNIKNIIGDYVEP